MAIGPDPPSTAAPAIARVWREVHAGFGRVVTSLGVFSCRRINFEPPPAPWSYHAWGQAWDIDGDSEVLDRVYAYLRDNRRRLRIRELLWRVEGHYGHLHVAAGTDRTDQVPPCASAEAIVHAQAVQALPTLAAAVVGETWAPAARQAAQELIRASERIGRTGSTIRSIIRKG